MEAADEAPPDRARPARRRAVAARRLALSLRLAAGQAEPATAAAIESASTSCAPHWPSCRLAQAPSGVLHGTASIARAGDARDALAVPVVLEAEVPERLPAGVETALYFVAAEALTNVAKYAQPTSVAAVTVLRSDRWAEVEVADDGSGGARADDGTGLRGLADRVEALGGELHVTSERGAGTTVRGRVPL